MNIKLILTGKTNNGFVNEGFVEYEKRLKHYIRFEICVIPELKNTKSLSFAEQKEKEADLQLKALDKCDHIVLLDDKGKEFTSTAFADFLNRRMNAGTKTLAFVIGGPYGFSERIYHIASEKISLSRMTFSHQIVRVLFAEQLYRAFTIINNEPYHHE
jgi:23S rRNA (pseudouridine1915-N3)-methyltransferase